MWEGGAGYDELGVGLTRGFLSLEAQRAVKSSTKKVANTEKIVDAHLGLPRRVNLMVTMEVSGLFPYCVALHLYIFLAVLLFFFLFHMATSLVGH